MDELRSVDFGFLYDSLLTLLTDPTSNIRAALLLYGLIALAALVLVLVVIAILISLPDDEIEEQAAGATVAEEPKRRAAAVAVPQSPYRFRSAAIALGVLFGITLAVWVLAGFTTSSNTVCGACHLTTIHDPIPGVQVEDPHKSTACVSCHEPAGMLGRYFTDVPSRVLHFVEGGAGISTRAGYGSVRTSACGDCHSDDIAGVTVNRDTGVRMSHAEPIAAAARCLDCHVPVAGVVSQKTTGMGACLRCHDQKTASSECSLCHDKRAAAAARARTTAFAKPQVEEIKCGGCHVQVKECDPCHGLRMPHSLSFKASGHARAGAADFWFNDGKTCARCHTPARRPCQKCHSAILGRGHQKQWAYDHQKADPSAPCVCHNQMAPTASRNFCKVCHPDMAVDARQP